MSGASPVIVPKPFTKDFTFSLTSDRCSPLSICLAFYTVSTTQLIPSQTADRNRLSECR